MKRKLTGWFLLMLMVVFTTMADTGLRYCLCQKVVFIGKCECEQVGFVLDQASKAEAEPACSCCSAQKTDDSESDEQLEVQVTCSVCCVIELAIEIEEFTLIEADRLSTSLADDLQTLSLAVMLDQEIVAVNLAVDVHSPRGSPPPFHRLSVPIYLRDSVYRI